MILLSSIVSFYYFRRILKSHRILIKYTLVTLLVLAEITFHVWYVVYDKWQFIHHLPFQLCSVSLYLCALMLLTNSYKIFEVAYFVSMTGALLAMITPELFLGFPHFRFFHFFIAHSVIIYSCLYMVLIENFTPSITSIFKSMLALNIIALPIFLFNKMVGSNYMFLLHKPSNPSPIDFLGPYPWYILSLEFVAFTLFLVLYLPFHIKKRNKKVD